MKIRTGFVSNSSSSSFMAAIGVVKDWDKFDAWKSKISSQYYDVILVDIEEDKKRNFKTLTYIDSTKISYEAPTNNPTFVSINREDYENIDRNIPVNIQAKNLLTEKGHNDIVIYCVSNDEGDSDFWNEEMQNLDYSKVDFNWFEKEQQKAYNEFNEENGIVLVDKTFGVGRNG